MRADSPLAGEGRSSYLWEAHPNDHLEGRDYPMPMHDPPAQLVTFMRLFELPP
jgi:hypothetical protein